MCAAEYHHAFGPITSDAHFGMHVFTLADDDEEEEQLDEPEEGQQDNNDGPANYCEFCEQWLNGPTQWEDHIIGKKHKKNRKKKWASFTVRYCSSLLHSYLKHSTNVNPSELSVQL